MEQISPAYLHFLSAVPPQNSTSLLAHFGGPDGLQPGIPFLTASVCTVLSVAASPVASTPVANTSADSASKPAFDSDEIDLDTTPPLLAAISQLSSPASSENFFPFSLAPPYSENMLPSGSAASELVFARCQSVT